MKTVLLSSFTQNVSSTASMLKLLNKFTLNITKEIGLTFKNLSKAKFRLFNLVLLLIVIPGLALGQTTTPATNPGTAASTGTGTGWSGAGNITTPGSPYASASIADGSSSSYLQATNYNFSSIPDNAIILGIKVDINRQASSTSNPPVQDNIVSLRKGTTIQATNKASSTSWPTSLTVAPYGGPDDLWGTSWSVTDIKSPNFGVVLSADVNNISGSTSRTATVDYIQISITYVVPYTISGNISNGGTALPGVYVAASDNNNAYTVFSATTTDASGNYSLTALPGSNVTIFPSLAGYKFNPVSINVSNVSSNLSGQNFAATPVLYQDFTNVGSINFPVPQGVVELIVEVIGGGGKGSSRQSPSSDNTGFGGAGGGAYSRSVIPVTPLQSYPGFVGAGSTTTSSGSDSWFIDNTTTLLAKGGSSVANNTTTGGSGGLASQGYGQIKFNGGNGANGGSNLPGGGGGSSAAFIGKGVNGIDGNGAIAFYNGGNGGNGGPSGGASTNGSAGSQPGGGGGGAYRGGSSTTAGGNGGNGFIRISYVCVDPDVPTITSNTAICTGQSINLSILSGNLNSATSWNWYTGSCGGTSAGTGTSISVSPTTTTTYYVRGVGSCTSAGSCASVTVTVNELPFVFNVTGGGSYCSGGTGVDVGLSGSELGVNYQLYGNSIAVDGLVAGTGAAINFGSQTIAGNYTIVATRTIGENTCTQSMTGFRTVTVNELPTITFGTISDICAGSLSFTIPYTGVTDAPDQYSISGTGIITVTNGTLGSSPITVNLSTPASGSSIPFTLSVSNSTTGCVPGTVGGSVAVNDLPIIAPIADGASAVCVNSETPAFTNATAGGVWSIEQTGGTASITQGGIVTGLSAGTVDVVYTYSDGKCSNKATTSLTVNPLPFVEPITGGAAEICVGTSTTFTNATTGGIWSIEPPGTLSASITSEGLVTGLSTGTVTVVYTYFDGTCSNRAITSLIVSPSMVINDVTVYSNSPVSNPLCPGEALVLTSPEGGTWYDWYDPNGDWISSDRITTLPDIQYSERGLYTVYIYNACYQFGFPKSIEVSLHQRPAPTITGSESVCLNSTHTYTTETGSGINSFAWSVTGGTYTGGTSTDNTVTVTWDNVGEGTVSVNYLDGNGCTAKDPTILNITVNSLPVPTITGLQSVCFNSTTTYTTQSGGGIKEYVWNVIGGTYTGGASTDNTVTVTWNATGAKSVSVNYTDINGCTAPAAAVYPVTVNQLPEPVISGPVTACQNVPGIVYSTLAGMEDYQWVIDGGTITSALPLTNTVTVTWQTLGAKNISVNFRDGNGCYAAAPTVYNVTVYPIPPLPVISGSSIVCQGNPGQIYTIGTGLPGYIYNWSISGGNIDSGTGTNSISVTWTSTGAHSISVYSTSNGCNSPTATYNVTVNTTPVQPSIITGTSTVCAGTTTPVSYSVTADPGVTKYVWSYSGTGVSFYSGENTNSMSVIYSPTATSGTWTVTPWNDCGAGSTPRTLAIAVNPLPGLITSMNGKTEQCATVYGEIYSISTDPDATSYSWTVPTGWSITSGQGTISITVVTGPTGANGNVTVTPKNACGSGTPYSTAVTVNLSAPAAPLDITGPATVCAGKTDVEYSTALVNGVTSWTWTVPEGWLITSGQTGDIGTAIIKVTAGNVGQGGIISVVANNGCGSSRTTINIKPLSSERSTGYVTSTGSIFGGEIRSSNNNPLGFVKFPLSAIPAGATIIGSTLSLTNNANLTPSDFINNKVTNIADYDPATISSGSLLHTAIINGISFNTSSWINTGTFSLSLNTNATDSIQSRLESPGYIAMGLVREGASYWKFYGYGSVNAPNLEVTYKDAAIKAVTINALPVAIAASESSSLCAGSSLQLYAGGGVSYSWVGPELTEPIFRSSDTNPLRTNVPTTGSGLYTVTVTDGNGCSSIATTRVSVNASAITTPGSIVYGASNASAVPLNASANCTSVEEIGPSNASLGVDNNSNGENDNWSNPGNITNTGSPYATNGLGHGATSTYLQGRGYGFEIPAGAKINGISVVINRMTSGGTFQDVEVRLVKAVLFRQLLINSHLPIGLLILLQLPLTVGQLIFGIIHGVLLTSTTPALV